MAKLRIAAPSHAGRALQEQLFKTLSAGLALLRLELPLPRRRFVGQGHDLVRAER
jgi:hypothetical protein